MLKAESAGSIPDGANLDETRISQPLQFLLRDIGNAVFALNTAVVGLDAVEHDYPKPDSLNISWAPHDREIAARTSRTFLLESVLVRASTTINEYVSALSKLPRFAIVREKWQKAAKKSQKATKISTKISTIAAEVLDKDDYLIPGVILLVHWRNHVVHPNSHAKLTSPEKQILLDNEDIISDRYRGLKTSKLLQDFETQQPTLKDISSLISMTINLARKVDKNMQLDLSKAELDAWLEHYQLFPMLRKIELETSPGKYGASVRRLLKSRAPRLLDAYLDHYDHSRPS